MGIFKGFTSVELRKPKRSVFDLSHEKRLTGRMGRLIPMFVSETLPNDTFHCDSEVLLRLAPILAPLMHRVNLFVHYFFVPNRLLWEDWEAFITNGRLGTETPPVPPNCLLPNVISLGYAETSSLLDYMGFGTIDSADSALYNGRSLDMMPLAAYYKVWYDYYRDRNYTADNDLLPLPSGNLSTSTYEDLFVLKTRHWEKDYFTSALPWTQRGSEVLMPLAGSGDVTYLSVSKVLQSGGANVPDGMDLRTHVAGSGDSGNLGYGGTGGAGFTNEARIENIDSVDITTSGVTINDFRQAIRLQEWLERNALAGSRYNESIMAHFGRRTSDSRLQRAEYLGGGKVVVKFSEVLTTAYSQDADSETVPPANMSGHGITFGNSNKFSYNCEEHGFVIGIMSVLPTSAYMQGTHKMFLGRNTFLDYPWPSFAHLGEQPVYDYEIFTDPTSVSADRDDQPVFGYQSRYSDWKYIPSSTHGDFKTSLDFWHLTREFTTQPSLGNGFVTYPTGMEDRVFAVADVDQLWVYIYNKCSVKRSLPYFGTPML